MNLYEQGREAWNIWAARHPGWGVDFKNAVFLKRADFEGFFFPKHSPSERIQFPRAEVDFSGVQFGDGDVNFSGVEFGDGHVNFNGAQFGDGNVTFAGTQFGDGNVDFKGAQFGDGNVDFRGSQFGDGNVDFSGVQFGDGDVNFISAEFDDGHVSFSGTQFGEGKVNFNGAQFGEGKFGEAKVSFGGIQFGDGDVNFNGAQFGGEYVTFSDTQFGEGRVSFVGAKFGDGTVNFNGAQFGDGEVEFLRTQFGEGYLSFVGAKFGDGTVNFNCTQFGNGVVDFFGTQFGDGVVDFSEAHFKAVLNFRNIDAGRGVTSKVAFSSAQFENALSLDGAKFHCVPNFLHASYMRDVSMNDMKIEYPKAKFFLVFRKSSERDNEEKFRKLKTMANKANDHEKEIDFFVGELQSKFLHSLNPLQYFPIFLYGVFSDFGRSVLRPFFALSGLWIGASYVYLRESPSETLHNAIFFSLVQTLPFVPWSKTAKIHYMEQLFGKPAIMSDAVHIMAFTQSFLSLILVFLIGLGIRNKLRL